MTLKPGCYEMSFKPTHGPESYVGTFRVSKPEANPNAEAKNSKARFSGDLYRKTERKQSKTAVPLFPLEDYCYYLEVFEASPADNAVVLDLRAHKYDSTTRSLVPGEMLKLRLSPQANRMSWRGPLLSGSQERGTVSLTLLGKTLRQARLRIFSIQPNSQKTIRPPKVKSAKGVPSWERVFGRLGWQLKVEQKGRSVADFNLPKDQSWSPYDLGTAALKLREELLDEDKDDGWVYDLLCVSKFDNEQYLGLMFDSEAVDLNEKPRESAAVAALQEWSMEGRPHVAQRLFGGKLYYRTAIHELGHAMNLPHNLRSNTFMNVTESMLYRRYKPNGDSGPMEFAPEWNFSAEEIDWLQHGPDIAIRPGGISRRALRLRSETARPAMPALTLHNQPELLLTIDPIRASFPLGAPIRLNYRLARHGWEGQLPADISLRSGVVMGRVIGPEKRTRVFRSAFRCCDAVHTETRLVKPGDPDPEGCMTLLRGTDGPLFPVPGAYRIDLEIRWDADGQTNRVVGRTYTLVDKPTTTAETAAAAAIQNEPALMPALVQGSLTPAGARALCIALQSELLAPHYLVTALRCFVMGTKSQTDWDVLFAEAGAHDMSSAGRWRPPAPTLVFDPENALSTQLPVVTTARERALFEHGSLGDYEVKDHDDEEKEVVELAAEPVAWLEKILTLTGAQRRVLGSLEKNPK